MYRKASFVNDSLANVIKGSKDLGKEVNKHCEKVDGRMVKAKLVRTQEKNALQELLQPLPRMQMRKIFVVLSRIHWGLRLKFQTLFLALEIYLKYTKLMTNPEQMIPEDGLIAVCMNLAMKYQEIYPPSLTDICKFAKISLSMQTYRKYEMEVLLTIDANLNLITASNLLEEYFKDQPKELYFQAYYFLEIAYISKSLVHEFSIELICKSIVNMLKPKIQVIDPKTSPKNQIQNMEKCQILLIIDRQKYYNNGESFMLKKYLSDRFKKVADDVIPLRR